MTDMGFFPSTPPYAPGDLMQAVLLFTGANHSMGITNTDPVYADARQAPIGDLLRDTPIYLGQSAGVEIDRLALIFDTSAIPVSAVITAARLLIFEEADSSFTDFDITIQRCIPPTPHIPVVLGDFDMLQYADDGGSLTTFGLGAGWFSVPFNPLGLTWINKGGITKLMVRSSRDIAGLWSGANEYIRITGPAGADFPRLEVTYT
jgi:hypothetical protein